MKIKGNAIKMLLLILSLVFAVSQAEAGNKKRIGTAGALELLIPVGSRGTALGGSFNASITGVEAIHWNPAGLARTDAGAQIMASHFAYFAGIDVEYVAAAAKFGDIGTFGISVKVISFGDIAVTTEAAPEGTGQTFSPDFITIGASYSKAMTDRISFGFNTKIISEKILNDTASGIAFDFGLQYSAASGVKLGVVLKNIGGNMKFDGNDAETRVAVAGSEPGTRDRPLRIPLEPFELPSTLEIGVSYDYKMSETNSLVIAGNFTNHNFGLDQYTFAGEYNYKDMIFLRGAYALAYDSESNSLISGDEDFIFGPSLGAGVNFNLGEFDLNVDYAYQTTKFFDDNQWFTLTLNF